MVHDPCGRTVANDTVVLKMAVYILLFFRDIEKKSEARRPVGEMGGATALGGTSIVVMVFACMHGATFETLCTNSQKCKKKNINIIGYI